MPWFLNSLVSSVAHRNGKKISALDNTFALIDEYIAADLSIVRSFSLAVLRRTIHLRALRWMGKAAV